MKSYTLHYNNVASLQTFIERNGLADWSHVLIQLNMLDEDQPLENAVTAELHQWLPHAHIVQSWEQERSAEFHPSVKAVIIFTVFEKRSVDDMAFELIQLNNSLEESEQRYKSLFEHNPNLIYSMDRSGRVLNINPAIVKETGYTQEEILNTPAISHVAEEHREKALEYFIKTLSGKPQRFRMNLVHKTLPPQLFDVTNIPIIVNEQVVGVYGVAQNITKQKQDEEKIVQLAYHDVLTGLPNRLLFQQTLDRALKEARGGTRKMAVMFIDIDRFKIINDSVGHPRGDEILKLAVAKMEQAVSRDCFLSRFSGDEFMLLIPEVDGAEVVRGTALNLVNAFHTPIVHDDREFHLSISIGISMYPNDGVDSEVLMKNADTALNGAKQRGGGNIQFYKQEMKNYYMDRLEQENDLRKALEKQELSLFYQPQICTRSGKVIGSEALIRWHHPNKGLVSPAMFIPLAEETGLIEEIGRWVLRTACRQAKEWQEAGYCDFFVSVNVSGRQFQRGDFLYDVKNALEESDLDPRHLHLELTESITLRDVKYSIQHVEALRALGVKVSVDDFGTGYSSLSYLKDFTIDFLKIDRSFVRNLKRDSHDGAIVKAILTMCDGLAVTAVAEGVETAEQLHLLKDFGCKYVQGFFYSKPLPADKFTHFISKTNAIQH